MYHARLQATRAKIKPKGQPRLRSYQRSHLSPIIPAPPRRWALLGGNGCGKSTLLRAIADAASGERFETGGDLTISPSLQLSLLEQTAVSGSESTVRDEVMSRMESFQEAKAALSSAELALSAGGGDASELEALESAQAAFEAAGGFAVDARVAKVLKGLGFAEGEFDRPCSSFSGGWQMRIALARLLLSEPSLLVLDEPTNHLDAAARRWLGEYVGSYAGTVLVVSHDVPFVSAAADSIAEVVGGRLELYKSTAHSKFVQERAERQERAVATVASQEREAKRLQGFIDRMGAKASKAKQAKDRQGKLGKLEVQMEAARALVVGGGPQPRLTLAPPPACDKVPLALRGASLRHAQGTQDILTGVDLELSKGMRLVVRGPNGAGKSTLLHALAGTLPLGSVGKRQADDRLRLGIFAQDLAQELPQDRGAYEYVAETVRGDDPSIEDTRIRTVMGSIGLTGEKATRRIGSLSGGEKARVALAVFCLTPFNVALFDEPSNHLDAASINALLSALDDYEGTVVIISHDRAFCEAIRCSHVAYVANGGVKVEERDLRPSDFSEADRGIANVEGAMEGDASPSSDPAAEKAAREVARQLQKARNAAPKKLTVVQQKIEAAENELEQLDAKMMAVGADASKALELSHEKQEVQARVDALYEQWSELEELIATPG